MSTPFAENAAWPACIPTPENPPAAPITSQRHVGIYNTWSGSRAGVHVRVGPPIRRRWRLKMPRWGRGGLAARLLTSHVSEPGPIPGGASPTISHEGIVLDEPLVRGFSPGSPVYPALAFRHCSILTSLHPHRLLRLRC
ncbi:hypothetical protein PR048_008530 [Dryococelus australis]|uniref:Uncharacterized protein n=1 Tax=Dryococelus australis TaxID=614101 RepID=A0ABQ9HXD4_9NEOP|nr:hypothetical protein PR048_008530 [Dryococelus australis]